MTFMPTEGEEMIGEAHRGEMEVGMLAGMEVGMVEEEGGEVSVRAEAQHHPVQYPSNKGM